LGWAGSVMWNTDTFKFVASSVLVKDRWVGAHEQVLNILIAYWCYGTSKHSSLPSAEGWLYPHCFNGCLGREIRYGSVDHSTAVLWIGTGAIFLWIVTLSKAIDDSACTDRVRYIWPRAIHGPSLGCVWRVSQVFPIGCTSIWITATLGYE
jgi:hypothetical protein